MAKLTPIKVVEKYDLNACRCCGLADKHRLYLFGDKSKSEGILKAFNEVTGFTDCEDSVSFLCRSCYAKVSNIVKKICELKSVFEEWERKRKVDNESLRYKRGHKEGDSPKQDDLVNTASPVRHVVKKAMATDECTTWPFQILMLLFKMYSEIRLNSLLPSVITLPRFRVDFLSFAFCNYLASIPYLCSVFLHSVIILA